MSRLLPLLLSVFAFGCAPDKADDDDDDDDDGGEEGGEEGGDTLSADPLALLLVVDNSASMVDQAGALARALPALDAARGQRPLRVGITTPSVFPSVGGSEDLEPGEAGTLVAPARSSDDTDWLVGLTQDLLCEATYWNAADVPSDPSVRCDDPVVAPELISQEYLDCLCGFDEWTETAAGSGDEQHLEAVLMAGCRIGDAPPEACMDAGAPFADSADLGHGDWPGADVERAHALIVSDEGDNSWRLPQGDEDATLYVDALASLPVPLSVSAALPPLRDGGLPCNDGGALTWGVERIEGVIASTDGVRGDLTEPDASGQCVPGDLDGLLDAWVRSR